MLSWKSLLGSYMMMVANSPRARVLRPKKTRTDWIFPFIAKQGKSNMPWSSKKCGPQRASNMMLTDLRG